MCWITRATLMVGGSACVLASFRMASRMRSLASRSPTNIASSGQPKIRAATTPPRGPSPAAICQPVLAKAAAVAERLDLDVLENALSRAISTALVAKRNVKERRQQPKQETGTVEPKSTPRQRTKARLSQVGGRSLRTAGGG